MLDNSIIEKDRGRCRAERLSDLWLRPYEEISRAGFCYLCYGGKSGGSGKDWRRGRECEAGCLCEYHPRGSIDVSLEGKSCQSTGSSSYIEIHQTPVFCTRENDQDEIGRASCRERVCYPV